MKIAKQLNGYYQKTTFDIDKLSGEEKHNLLSNMLTEGPKFKEVKMTKVDANSTAEILFCTHGRKGHAGHYHYETAIKALLAYGAPIPYNSSEKRSTGMYATEYLDEMLACYRVENGNLIVYGTKELI